MGLTRFAQNDLARLGYEVTTNVDGDDGSTPIVVLLHATLTSRASLDPLRDELLERIAVRVIQPDARGHGVSAALTNRSFTVTDMANDLYAVLEAEGAIGQNAPELHLVGHGQGAIAALELTRRRPDLVTSLVLLEPDAVALLDGHLEGEIVLAREEARFSTRAAADAAYKGLTDQALASYLDRRWGDAWSDRLTKPRLAAVRRHITALSPSLDALDGYRLLPEELAAMRTPTLIVVAAESPAAERAVARRLGETIPSATARAVTSLPGGAPFTGNGEIAISTIADWLAARIGPGHPRSTTG
jgi:pimeloyl-ACP methyl ester carboxylesterase